MHSLTHFAPTHTLSHSRLCTANLLTLAGLGAKKERAALAEAERIAMAVDSSDTSAALAAAETVVKARAAVIADSLRRRGGPRRCRLIDSPWHSPFSCYACQFAKKAAAAAGGGGGGGGSGGGGGGGSGGGH